MQETLDAIIGEHQSDAIKNRIILHTASTICDITDVSNKLNKNFSVISSEFILSFLFLHKIGYGDKFVHMIKVDSHNSTNDNTNIKSKIKINDLLSDTLIFMQVCLGWLLSMLLYIIATEVLANFINTDKMIKEIQIGDHEIKIVNFADNTTILLRDFTSLDRIQVILKLYENAKIN